MYSQILESSTLPVQDINQIQFVGIDPSYNPVFDSPPNELHLKSSYNHELGHSYKNDISSFNLTVSILLLRIRIYISGTLSVMNYIS